MYKFWGDRLCLQVLIDVNWRPVFFEEEAAAKKIILPYVEKGDILKMSDEEAEFLYSIPRNEALNNPKKVSSGSSTIRPYLKEVITQWTP